MATTQNWRDQIAEYDVNAREWNRRFGPECPTECCLKEVEKRLAVEKENVALKRILHDMREHQRFRCPVVFW